MFQKGPVASARLYVARMYNPELNAAARPFAVVLLHMINDVRIAQAEHSEQRPRGLDHGLQPRRPIRCLYGCRQGETEEQECHCNVSRDVLMEPTCL